MNSWQFFCRMVLVKALPPTTKISLVVLLQLVDQRHEIAVAADDGEGVDVVVRKRQFQRVERQVDVAAVLIAARRRIALHHLHGVFGELARRVLHASPVGVGDLGDDLAPLFQRFEHHRNVELALQRRFDADLDIVEVDEDRDLEVLFHVSPIFKELTLRSLRAAAYAGAAVAAPAHA